MIRVDVVLARWVELGAQIEGPGLGLRLEPVEFVVEGREASDQDTLPRPGRFPDSQGREGDKPSHEQVILHEPAVERILGQ